MNLPGIKIGSSLAAGPEARVKLPRSFLFKQWVKNKPKGPKDVPGVTYTPPMPG